MKPTSTLAVIVSAVISVVCFRPSLARDLTFEDRVQAQEAIERVYYSHRIGVTKPFETEVPREVLERKVRSYLTSSDVTADMLSRERERIVRDTRSPGRLRELFDALGNDPFLIEECLARPALVARLATTLEPRRYHTAVWTGSEMIVWGGQGDESQLDTGERYDPALDTWSPTSTIGAPAPRQQHTAVWVGGTMVVWGGLGANYVLATGGRYDPVSDTWSSTSSVDAPSARYHHTAVSTGSTMIVWGGHARAETGTGAWYDPATDRWHTTSQIDAPRGRSSHTAVWTGSEMIVWGGAHGHKTLSSGGRYDPATDHWVPMSQTDAPGKRMSHTAVWTGSVIVVWGGGLANDDEVFDSGGRYDPATDTWTRTRTAGAPERRENHTAIWTGTEMVVWGGGSDCCGFADGARYDPVANRWTPVSLEGAPTIEQAHSDVWTGDLMIIWGGYGEEGNTGGRYDPVADAWTPTAPGRP